MKLEIVFRTPGEFLGTLLAQLHSRFPRSNPTTGLTYLTAPATVDCRHKQTRLEAQLQCLQSHHCRPNLLTHLAHQLPPLTPSAFHQVSNVRPIMCPDCMQIMQWPFRCSYTWSLTDLPRRLHWEWHTSFHSGLFAIIACSVANILSIYTFS